MESSKTYTYDEAFEASLAYFGGDELAARVWVNKYAMKDSFGNIYEKSPEQMHWRIANEIARIEKKYKNPMTAQEIFDLLDHFRYIVPAGSPMTGIGNDHQIASLSNCFVIGLDGNADSYGAVMRIDEEQVQLMKRRGGVGHDLSHIRPKGSPVNNSALTSTGLVPFMERYSNSTREVAQDGRRGALMLSVSIKHPDSEAFIDAKMTEGKVTGANVSVKIDDEFMRAATEDKPYVQQFPITGDNPDVRKEISAKALWEKIVHNAWKSAEPGVLFWDTILRESIPDCYADLGFRTVSTNPCGEIPLCPYDSCRLLSINLYSYVRNAFTKKAYFDYELFKKHVQMAQRLMDDIVDLELEKIDLIMEKIESDPQSMEVKGAEMHLWEKIKAKSSKGRRTGVGITAEGDMIAAMGLRYGTQEATDFSVEVHKTLALNAYRSSVEMAKERGAFEIYDAKREENNPFIRRIKDADPALYADMVKSGRRNIACLTPARLYPSPQGEPQRHRRTCGLCGRGGRLVRGIPGLSPQVHGMDEGERHGHHEALYAGGGGRAGKQVALLQGYGQRRGLADEGAHAGCHPEVGGPLYQRDGEPAQRRRRGTGEPPVCRGLALRLQGMYHLSRRKPLGRDDQRVEERKEGGQR